MSTEIVNITTRERLYEPGFRYKRERVAIVHEHFKGHVTRVTNTRTLAKQLQIELDDMEKGLEKCVKRTLAISTCGSLTFPGKIEARKLDDILQSMIERYVLCPRCGLPEWNRVHCNACGFDKTSSGRKDDDVKSFATVDKAPISTFEIDTDYGVVPEWEQTLSLQMHKLYALRTQIVDEEELKKIDLLLDACWVSDTPDRARKVSTIYKTKYSSQVIMSSTPK